MKSQIVYIRQVDEESLPEELRDGQRKAFAVHDAESGEQLAITADRRIAFALALKNDMKPISVH